MSALLEATERTTETGAGRIPLRGRMQEHFGQALVLTVLLAVPALLYLHGAALVDPDIWWHLRAGDWILQHHAVPQTDFFSGPNAGKPWAAYSWIFEALTDGLFRRFGLSGILVYTAAMLLAITAAIARMVRRLHPDPLVTVALTSIACLGMTHLVSPRPWLFTILFFVLELDILMQARRTGRMRGLLWLPVIFALWSNVHIQFIDGLVVLALALAEAMAARLLPRNSSRLKAGWMLAAFAGSVGATLANPYGAHIYRVAYDLASQPGVQNKIAELQAMRFRDLPDFCVLGLAIASAAALAWTRRLQVFELGLLALACVVSFRSERDVWLLAVAAVAVLASTGQRRAAAAMPGWVTGLAVLSSALVVAGGFRAMHVADGRLEASVARSFPVHAVEAMRRDGYAGQPIFNDFDWGGYLAWALRAPVSIDGRAAFYGDAAIDRSMATWNGAPDWAFDDQLKRAGVVLGPRGAALTQLLRTDARFALVYEDEVAAVFVRR